MKISELTGAALDWAVAKCEGEKVEIEFVRGKPEIWEVCPTDEDLMASRRPSTNWGEAGPIIDKYGITTIRCDDDYGTDAEGFSTLERIPVWAATVGQHNTTSSTEHQQHDEMYQIGADDVVYGPTPLVAAMRAYVALKHSRSPYYPDWNKEIDIPGELL